MKLDVRFSIDFADVSELQQYVSRCCRAFYSGDLYVLEWSTLYFKCLFDPHDVEYLASVLFDAVNDDDPDIVSGRDYWFGVDLDQCIYYLGYDDDFVFASGCFVGFRSRFRHSNPVALRS